MNPGPRQHSDKREEWEATVTVGLLRATQIKAAAITIMHVGR